MNHSIEILQQWLVAIHRLKIGLAVIKQMLEKNELHTFEWIPAK